MKKLILSALSLTFILSAAFFASGCGKKENHTHSFTQEIAEDKYLASNATCSEGARYYYSCKCGETGTETFEYGASLGHKFTNYVSDNNAKCTEDGTKTAKCDRCSETDTVTDVGSKLGHEFTNYISDNNATYEKDGTKTAHCNRKGCTATDTIADEGTKLESKMTFKTLTVGQKNIDGNVPVYGKVPNFQKTYSFIDEVKTEGNVQYVVSLDIYGIKQVATKTIPLTEGDNVVYITEQIDGNPKTIYEVTIRRRKIYTVSFNLQGGSAVESQQIEEDSLANEPSTTKTGYSFIGWDYDFSKPVTDNITITASWKVIVYNITYKLNGGILDNTSPKSYTVEDTIVLDTPAKLGYDFIGWSDEGRIDKGSIGDKTFVADWKPTIYNINYNLDGGANDENNPTTYTVETPTIGFAAPSKTGYTFNGWYAEKDFSGDNVTELPQSSYGNVTLYAKWTANKYTITYLDTKLITGTKNTFVYAKGETYVQSVTYDKNYDLINYERTGYAKTGWFNGDEKFDGGIWNLTNDVTLYADWQIVTYNITYVLNGGETIGANPTEYTIESQDITLADPTGKHTFVGWYKDEALKEKITVITNRSFGDITLYADWQHETTTDWVIDKAPTCTNTGLRHKVCSVCGVNYNYETLATVSTAHVRGEEVKENVVDPTCTKDGSYDSVYYCSECNIELSRTTKTTTKLGHKRGSEVKENVVGPTCTQNGSYDVVVYCTECNKELSRVTYAIPIVDHNLNENHVCTICGKSSSDGLSFTLRGDVYELTSIGTCTDINVLIPDTYQNKAVTSIGSKAFLNCRTLIRITIPDSVTSIGNSAFYGCRSLTSITIPNGVTSIGWYAFSGCSGLTSITIPDSVTSIGDRAFYDCSGLISITIPDSVTSVGDSAFSGCSSLTSVTIGNGVTSIGEYAFSGCYSLTSITIPKGVTSIGNSAFYGCSSLTSVTIGNGVTSIGESAFYNCSGLISITIPDGVTSIGNYAFEGCSSLTSVTIGNGVTSIGDGAFYNCNRLTSVTIGNSVTSIGESAFRYCRSLTSITIPDGVTSIGNYAFSGCSGIESLVVTIGNKKYHSANNCVIETDTKTLVVGCKTSVIPSDGSVTSIGSSAFRYCRSLTSITIPDGVTSIGSSAFEDCSSLTSITIPDGVTSIGNYAFYKCSGLTSITIPDSVTSIGASAFYDCSGLTSVTIGNGVTSIGDYVFHNCSSLTSITIPDGVTSIGGHAFEDCSSLKTVFYKGTAAQWKKISIDSYNGELRNAARYYYSESEPALSSDGTAYDVNYWHYDTDGKTPVIWKKEN